MPYEFTFTCRIEFAETDLAGIVHFANFYKMMENAEHAFFRSMGFIVHDVFDELQRNRCVSDGTYARAVAALGEKGVVELVGIIGYYSTLAMIMNVAQTPAPADGLEPHDLA